MAKHATQKNTTDGKQQTISRRQQRVRKYATPGLDLDALATELRAQQRRAANTTSTKGDKR